jgi:quercetin dioxygenase-like cupin family protein
MNDTSLKTAILTEGRLGGSRPVCQPHPAFAGVTLCRVVGAEESDNALTTLVVTLAPSAAMAPHRHGAETEQHIVMEGEGTLTLDGVSHAYRPGLVAIIPKGHEHAVVAGESGMVLLAVFSPGLS